MAEHGDALDFDLFDRWRVRLADVPSTIGWGAVALYLRHMPLDSALARELDPRAEWTTESHLLACIADMLGARFAGRRYEPIRRPQAPAFEGAVPVSDGEYAKVLAQFRGEAPDG